MRIKGETPEEMAGFLDAVACAHAIGCRPATRPVVVLPSYNGARRLPVLTPLLALMLARKGLPVLLHGAATEDAASPPGRAGAAGHRHPCAGRSHRRPAVCTWCPPTACCPASSACWTRAAPSACATPAHSLVKLMNPVDGPALVVGSYTHPEYAESMAATFRPVRHRRLLLRGTEGEPVADARRTPRMVLVRRRDRSACRRRRSARWPPCPAADQIDAATTADFIRAVMEGAAGCPNPSPCRPSTSCAPARPWKPRTIRPCCNPG
jgi:anthranilate phosphoribosyltransferase